MYRLYIRTLAPVPNTTPPTAPAIVFFGLMDGHSFLPPKILPTKNAKVSATGEITKMSRSASADASLKEFAKIIVESIAVG